MEWITSLYKETSEIWKKNGSGEAGYSIFYSPVSENPELLIIGFNPGGDADSFVEHTEPPLQHDYIIGNYKMANRMRSLFHAAGLSPMLGRSVKMNLIYFRTKDAAGVKSLPKEMLHFCYEQAREVIELLRPKNILVEGFGTFEILSKLLDLPKARQSDFNNKAVMLVSEYNGAKVISIPHPTGARLSNEQFNEISRLLRQELYKEMSFI